MRLRSIQALRFIAASLVVTTHIAYVNDDLTHQPLVNWQHIGSVGVDIFFVVSGFIICKIAFIDKRANPTSFAKDRLVRVAPLYYILTLPWLFWPGNHPTPARLISSFLFWPAAGSEISLPMLTVGWTLCFEMLFYLAAALILTTRHIRTATTLAIALWCLATFTRYAAPASSAGLAFVGNPMILEFLFGVAIAHTRWRSELGGALAVLAGVIVFARLGPIGSLHDGQLAFDGTLAPIRVLVFGVPAAAVVYGTVQLERLFVGPFARAMTYLGDASYSLYLTHLLVVLGIQRTAASIGLSGLSLFVTALTLSLVLGIAVHALVERPLLRTLRRAAPVASPSETVAA